LGILWRAMQASNRPNQTRVRFPSISCVPDAQFIYSVFFLYIYILKGAVHIFLRIKKSGCMSPTEYYRFDFTLIELKKLL
jgi:hypothetical protein